jgi:hypothetical protein
MYSSADLITMEECLELCKGRMSKLLQEPQSHNNCLELAGILRLLLVNTEMPVLLKYADAQNIPLEISEPHQSPLNGITDGLIMAVQFPSPHWKSFNSTNNIPIKQYLETPLGVTPIKNQQDKIEGDSYTPQKIIKWYANKCGVTHLELKKPLALESLFNFTIPIHNKPLGKEAANKCIFSLAEWCLVAMTYSLMLKDQIPVIMSNTKLLENEAGIDINSITRYAHFCPLKDGGALSSFLIGGICSEAQLNTTKFYNGFSIHMMIKAFEYKKMEPSVVLALGKNKHSVWEIGLTPDFNLYFIITLSENEKINLKLPEEYREQIKEKYCSISCYMTLKNNQIKITIFINGQIAIEHESNSKALNWHADNFIIGADLNKNKPASLFLSELFLSDAKNISNARYIAKYLWENLSLEVSPVDKKCPP